MTILNRLYSFASKFPQKAIYSELDDSIEIVREITYADFLEQVRISAQSIRQKVNSSHAIILLPQGINFNIAFFGCLLAGKIAVPLPTPTRNKGTETLKSILSDTETKSIISDKNTFGKISKQFKNDAILEMNWCLIDDFEAHGLSDFPLPNLADIAFLQYTSGSTGKPKGVMVSHGNIMANSEMIQNTFQTNSESVSLTWLPNFHDMGLIDGVIQPIYGGFRNLIMKPMDFVTQPANWIRALSSYKVTYSGGPNFAFDHCTERVRFDESETIDLSTLNCLYNGAEPIRATTLQKFHRKFERFGLRKSQLLTCYGMAEATLAVSTSKLGKETTILKASAQQLKMGKFISAELSETSTDLVSCGFPKNGLKVMIVEPETCIELGGNEVGEIWVKGESIAKEGYWKKMEQSQAVFNAKESRTEENGYLRTGDLGFIHEGEIYITGRMKDVIILKGLNYYAHDLEQTAENSCGDFGKNSSAAFSVEKNDEEKVVIVQEIRRRDINEPNLNVFVRKIAQSIFSKHQVPVHDVVLISPKSLPKTTSGKIRRTVCKQNYLNGELKELARFRNET